MGRYAPLPVPTVTVAHRALDVIAWPPQPTTPPVNRAEFRRRQEANTVCGYLGGDANLPATCGAGSHCVLDPAQGAIGCCPDGQAPCTTGIFTGCVDGNSAPQTEVNPYVYTCGGGNVCYKNQFDGGFYQFGCGTASNLATTVIASASGITLTRPTETFSFTMTPTSLSEPTTLGTTMTSQTSSTSLSSSTTLTSSSTTLSSTITSTSTSSTSSTTSSSTTTSSTTSSTALSSTTSSITSSASDTASSTPAGPSSSTTSAPTGGAVNLGAIIGGTLGGIALLLLAIAVGFWLYRRRNGGNPRQGPGAPPLSKAEYITPISGPRTGFVPVHQTFDGYESGLATGTHDAEGRPYHMGYAAEISGGNGVSPEQTPISPYHGAGDNPYYSPDTNYHYAGHYAAAYAGAGAAVAAAGGAAYADHGDDTDQTPLTREIDDFTRGFHTALGRIGEEDEYNDPSSSSGEHIPVNEGNGVTSGRLNGHSTASEVASPARNFTAVSDDEDDSPVSYGSRPLWQQNRRASRGPAWM